LKRCWNWLPFYQSRGIPHVRTDFYSINEHIYFGELTFHHGSGYEKFAPESLNFELGKSILLPNIDVND
jgi:hypothetical protein